jgi:hypothetical protein
VRGPHGPDSEFPMNGASDSGSPARARRAVAGPESCVAAGPRAIFRAFGVQRARPPGNGRPRPGHGHEAEHWQRAPNARQA